MRPLNYRQGFMAALIMLVFFAGEGLGHTDGVASVLAAGVVVGLGVAGGVLLLRSAESSSRVG